jgi:hypothetical protein
MMKLLLRLPGHSGTKPVLVLIATPSFALLYSKDLIADNMQIQPFVPRESRLGARDLSLGQAPS